MRLTLANSLIPSSFAPAGLEIWGWGYGSNHVHPRQGLKIRLTLVSFPSPYSTEAWEWGANNLRVTWSHEVMNLCDWLTVRWVSSTGKWAPQSCLETLPPFPPAPLATTRHTPPPAHPPPTDKRKQIKKFKQSHLLQISDNDILLHTSTAPSLTSKALFPNIRYLAVH